MSGKRRMRRYSHQVFCNLLASQADQSAMRGSSIRQPHAELDLCPEQRLCRRGHEFWNEKGDPVSATSFRLVERLVGVIEKIVTSCLQVSDA